MLTILKNNVLQEVKNNVMTMLDDMVPKAVNSIYENAMSVVNNYDNNEHDYGNWSRIMVSEDDVVKQQCPISPVIAHYLNIERSSALYVYKHGSVIHSYCIGDDRYDDVYNIVDNKMTKQDYVVVDDGLFVLPLRVLVSIVDYFDLHDAEDVNVMYVLHIIDKYLSNYYVHDMVAVKEKKLELQLKELTIQTQSMSLSMREKSLEEKIKMFEDEQALHNLHIEEQKTSMELMLNIKMKECEEERERYIAYINEQKILLESQRMTIVTRLNNLVCKEKKYNIAENMEAKAMELLDISARIWDAMDVNNKDGIKDIQIELSKFEASLRFNGVDKNGVDKNGVDKDDPMKTPRTNVSEVAQTTEVSSPTIAASVPEATPPTTAVTSVPEVTPTITPPTTVPEATPPNPTAITPPTTTTTNLTTVPEATPPTPPTTATTNPTTVPEATPPTTPTTATTPTTTTTTNPAAVTPTTPAESAT